MALRRPPRLDRAARARGRARPRRRRGRPAPRDHRDRRPHRQVGRAGAPLRAAEGLAAPAADQPVRHRAAHVPRLRRRAPRRRRQKLGTCSRCSRRGPRREGRGPDEAEVDRRLAPEDRPRGPVPGGRPHRRRRRPRPAADPDLLAGRRGAVHHPPRRDHEGPADRRPQRRHVPDAEDRPALDLHALADPQGRAHGLPGHRRPARGRGRARARPGHGVLRERAAAQARRRADDRRLPPRRARSSSCRRRRSTSRCPRTPRSCSRGYVEKGDVGERGPVRRPHRLLHAARAVPGLPPDGDDDAARRDLPVDRRRQAAGRGRVARQGDRADLPAGDPDVACRRSSTTTCRSPAPSTTA